MTEQERKDLEMVKKDGYDLRYVKNQTEQVCLAAVKQNGWALQYVKNQTESICLEATKNTTGRIICLIDNNRIFYSITYEKYFNKYSNNPFLF